jgi:signal recognition particle receptor subunit beta
MAQVENVPPSIALKLVYCGPFGSGKTSNLHQLYTRLTDRYRSRMLSLDLPDIADEEILYHAGPIDAGHRPTMFYDLLPIVLNVAGVRVILRLLAGPGHVMHEHTRRLVLRGADGLAFIADTQRSLEENEQALAGVRSNLRDNGLAPDTLPMVVQLNKRDLPEVRTDAAEAQRLRGHRADIAIVPAVARTGVGVVETLLRLLTVVWPSLIHEHAELAASEVDLPALLLELGRTINASDVARALTSGPGAGVFLPAAEATSGRRPISGSGEHAVKGASRP